MPTEYWVAAALAAIVGLGVGVWLGRRSIIQARSHAVLADVAAANIASSHAAHASDAAQLARPGTSVAQLGEQLEPADQLGIGLVRVNPDGTVESANRSAADLLGWRPRGLVGKSMLEAFLDHGVEQVVAEARDDGHASGEYVLSGEPPKTDFAACLAGGSTAASG